MTKKRNAFRHRAKRLQVMVSIGEMAAIEDFQYRVRLPSLAAAVRELLRRGLASANKVGA